MSLGNPVVPRNPTFRGIRPGPEAIRPSTKVYGLIDKGDSICLMGDGIARRFKGLRTQAKRSRMRGMGK